MNKSWSISTRHDEDEIDIILSINRPSITKQKEELMVHGDMENERTNTANDDTTALDLSPNSKQVSYIQLEKTYKDGDTVSTQATQGRIVK